MEDKMLMEKRFISLFFYFQQFTTPKLPAFTKRGKKKLLFQLVKVQPHDPWSGSSWEVMMKESEGVYSE